MCSTPCNQHTSSSDDLFISLVFFTADNNISFTQCWPPLWWDKTWQYAGDTHDYCTSGATVPTMQKTMNSSWLKFYILHGYGRICTSLLCFAPHTPLNKKSIKMPFRNGNLKSYFINILFHLKSCSENNPGGKQVSQCSYFISEDVK